MKNILSLAAAIFMIAHVFGQVTRPNITPSNNKALNDTIVFDILNANYYSNAGSNFIEIPVILKSNNPNINSFDFWFQFNQTELTYVSTTSLVTGLDAFSNFNQANFYLSNTSSGTSINFNIPINVPVVKLTFQLSAACNLINSQDFSNITTLFDGIVSSHKITAPLPSQIQVASPLPTCTNNDITFTYDAFYAGKPISTYNWDFGNSTLSNLQTDSTQYPNAGSYTVSLDVTTQDACVYSLTFPIEIMQGPVASFTSATGASLTEIVFTSTSTFSSGSITQYAWDFGDGNTSNLENPTHDFPGADTYPVTLTVTADNSCSNTVVGNVSTVGLIEFNKVMIEVFPNPTTTVLQIKGELPIGPWEILDLKGKSLLFGTQPNSFGLIQIENLSKGTYVIKFKDQAFQFIKI
jgi:chitodextrinase